MPYYPNLAKMQLVDYKVRVLDNGAGTGARVRVLIESTDGSRRWGTVGVSANVVEASWQALLDSVEFKLHKDQSRPRKPAATGDYAGNGHANPLAHGAVAPRARLVKKPPLRASASKSTSAGAAVAAGEPKP
jgi:hypothetical protein